MSLRKWVLNVVKEIQLTQGYVALVDDCDFDYLNQWKWSAHLVKCGVSKKPYAVRGTFDNKTINIHRQILNAPKGACVDHINGDTLDNRRINLRLCTIQQNCFNQRKVRRKTSSKYKGVCLIKENHKWISSIKFNHKQILIGVYFTEQMAALQYNIKAKEFYGDFAYLNVLDSDIELILKKEELVKCNWYTTIAVNKVAHFLGYYKDEVQAAKAYNDAALKYHESKAKLNILPEGA
jgi:hypothetical protein